MHVNLACAIIAQVHDVRIYGWMEMLREAKVQIARWHQGGSESASKNVNDRLLR